MPYVIREMLTGDYVQASDPKDINTARLFSRINNATSSSFQPALHEVVKVNLVEDLSTPPHRKGELLDDNEVARRYGPVGYQVNENIGRPGYGYDIIVAVPPVNAPHKLFSVFKKVLYQSVYVALDYSQSGVPTIHGPFAIQVHPHLKGQYIPRLGWIT